MQQVLIIGYGGIGAALAAYYAEHGYAVTVASRQPPDHHGYHWRMIDEQALPNDMPWLKDLLQQDDCLIICTIGVLHTDHIQPEKSIRQFNVAQTSELMHHNLITPMLWLQHISRYIDRRHSHKILVLSAKVGSISDNQLGGWYSYRASKAALNMMVKTFAIELKRSGYRTVVAAVHPGTTDTALSAPFQRGLAEGYLQSPAQTAARLAQVMAELIPAQHGCLLNWDGQVLPF